MRVQVRFDSLPGPEGSRLIEVEDLFGHSVSVGEWVMDGKDALLLLDLADGPTAEREAAIKAFVEAWDRWYTADLGPREQTYCEAICAARERLLKARL